MPLNDVVFILGQGGIGRPAPGQDYISGMIVYGADANLPSGFTTSARVKQFFSVLDAENAGITNTHADETPANAEYLVTAAGNTADTVTVKVTEATGNVVTLAVYTRAVSDTTPTLVAAGIAAAINAGTKTTGYSATTATATVTIVARGGLGISLDTGTPLSVVIVGSVAGTITQFAGGVASRWDRYHYHISEFFRANPTGNLYFGIYAVPSSYVFAEVAYVQNFANGTIRQMGVYVDSTAYTAGMLDALHAACQSEVSVHKEVIGILGADISSVSDITTLADLSTHTSNLAAICIAQDGAALGYTLYKACGKSVTALGAMLGSVSAAKVSESIAWVAKFNQSNGVELDTPALANGVLLSDPTINDGVLGSLQDKRYTFLRKIVGVAGAYWNENATAVSATSDYAYIADNRTMQKATRNIYASVIVQLNGPITLNADGTPSDEAVAYLTSLAQTPLDAMIRNQELSAHLVTIDTTQNVQATGLIIIAVVLTEVGTSRKIQVNIGFGVSTVTA